MFSRWPLPSVSCIIAQSPHYQPPPHPLRTLPAEPDRKYFTNVADATPQDTMLLTLGCGKFRFYDHDYGMLPNTPLPRLVRQGCGFVGGGTLGCRHSHVLTPSCV